MLKTIKDYLPVIVATAAFVVAMLAFISSWDDARDRYLKAERVLWEQNFDRNSIDEELSKAEINAVKNVPTPESTAAIRARRDVVHRRYDKALKHMRECRAALFGE